MLLSTHSQRLENWLGKDECEQMVASMKDWYGPPIAVGNVPGKVYVTKGGDFRGHIEAGEASLWDMTYDKARRMEAAARRRFSHWLGKQQQGLQLNTGFASLSDLISEAAAGKKRDYYFNKVGVTGVVAATNTLWNAGGMPSGGAGGASAPGGTVHTSADGGALFLTNPAGGDTQHLVSAWVNASTGTNQLLLYDRLFSVAKTMNSTATEAVTGVPTRYQNTSVGDDYIGGNFLFIECVTALAATAHNWTVCTYNDQGNAASTLPSLTGNSGNIAARIDHPTGQWFAPLASGDDGIKALTQMQCSALVATGSINFVIGHPIAIFPCPITNLMIPYDGISGAFQLTRIFDSACLTFLEVTKGATTATTYNGQITTVSG